MGNYKEGSIKLCLSPKTPFAVVESLVDLMHFRKDENFNIDSRDTRIEKLRKTRKEKFFQGCIDRLHVDIEPTISMFSADIVETVDIKSYVVYSYCVDNYITDIGMIEDLYCDDKFDKGIGITMVKNELKKCRYKNLYVNVRVCAKQYSAEFDDLIEYLRPYLIENHPNKVGHIKDEDGYLNKDLYLDRDLMKREIASRKYICAGCKNYQANFDCPYWKKCLRAFEIGQKSKKSKG